MVCPRCSAEVPVDERFCGQCGLDLSRDRLLVAKAGKARGWILAVGAIYLLGAVLHVTSPRFSEDVVADQVPYILAAGAVRFLVHLGLWWWARTAPFAAALVAMIFYVTSEVVAVVADPEHLRRGIIIRVVFLAVLVQALRAGWAAHRVRREHG
ncbi:MAG: zinc ribbon domain-containing protein [Caldilineaceae bacterium]|nr:zinc ribbon domain-containing protein [Caldilineaceae bacterium]